MLAPKRLTWVLAALSLSARAEQAGHAGASEDEAPAAREAALPPCPGYDPKDDPHSFNSRFTVGPNRGKCIDMRFRRPIEELTGAELARFAKDFGVKLQPGDRVIANVTDDEHNYYAVIPANPVEEIIAQKEHFDPNSKLGARLNKITGYQSHMQSRFGTKPGREILLIPQSARDRAKGVPRRTVHSLVASAEALTFDNDTFDGVKGVKNHFAIATRLVTLEAKKKDVVDLKKHHVPQVTIKPVVNQPGDTPDSVRQKYFHSALRQSLDEAKSFRAERPVMYNTLQNSCFTRGFLFYDQVNHYTFKTQELAKEMKRNPMGFHNNLFRRGMMHLNPNPFTWNENFEDEVKRKGANFRY